MKTLTVICPVYNEEAVIEAFYKELSSVLETLKDRYACTVLFVMDQGTDSTFEILKSISQQNEAVQVLAMSGRFGHQMSLLAGLDHCNSDVAVMMDSDLQHPPGLIPVLLEKYEEGYDVVYTCREDNPNIGFLKQTTSRLFYRFINRISDVPIRESAADFRLVSRRVLSIFQTEIRERNQFLRGLFNWVGFDSAVVSFKVQERRAGESKYSMRRMLRFATDGIVSFSKKPLQAAILAGLCFAAFGFALTVLTIIQYFLYSSWPPGWATLVILMSVFSSTQLVFLGILGEYIGAIFDEVKARPHYIVREGLNIRPRLRRVESRLVFE